MVDGSATAIADHANDELGPAVAAGPGDHWGVVYNRFVAEAPYGTQRVFVREVAPK